MKTFTYCGLNDCYFVWDTYRDNGNTALLVRSKSEGPVVVVTVNTGIMVPGNCIVVKNYSENDGIEELLMEQGIIGKEPVSYISINQYGTKVPVYEILETAYEKDVV